MLTALYTVRAAIEETAGDADALVGSWEVADDLGLTSRGFNLQAAQIGQLQVGNEVDIAVGYDTDRVAVMRGRIDTTDDTLTPNERRYTISGRDQGIKEILDSPITFVWEARPPSVLPRAHTILREAAALVGVEVAALAFPDYPLYASYVAHRKTLLEIVQDLLEPWNLFGQLQHVPMVRDKTLSVLRIDWTAPVATGYIALMARQTVRKRAQREYTDPPRLATVIEIVIRGASYTQTRPNLGIERRYIYNLQRRVDREIIESVAGTYTEFVWVEVSTLEERLEGKVVHTEETHYQGTITASGDFTNTTLVRRVTVDYEYYVPNQAIQSLVAFEPISLREALLWSTLEVHEGIDPTTQIFGPQARTFKQYYYDDKGQQNSEVETAQEYDTTAGAWKPNRVTVRTHSQTSSSTVRTQLTSYTVDADNDNELAFDVLDSQQVGGQLITSNSLSGRDDVESVQVTFPQLELINGIPTERRRSSNAWVYENAYIGQDEAETLYNLAIAEREFQLLRYRWDVVEFEGTLDPNLWVGQPLHLEVEEDEFRDYVIESVRHRFDVNGARSSGTAKRLTLEELPDDV